MPAYRLGDKVKVLIDRGRGMDAYRNQPGKIAKAFRDPTGGWVYEVEFSDGTTFTGFTDATVRTWSEW